eukprot:343287-Pleurochrysis_carterae.AAC.9
MGYEYIDGMISLRWYPFDVRHDHTYGYLYIASAVRAVKLQGEVFTVDFGAKFCGVPKHTRPLLLLK